MNRSEVEDDECINLPQTSCELTEMILTEGAEESTYLVLISKA